MADSGEDGSPILGLLPGLIVAMPAPVFVVGLDDSMLAANEGANLLLGTGGDLASASFKELPLSYRAVGLRFAVERVKRGGGGARLTEQPLTVGGVEQVVVFDVAPLRLDDRLVAVMVTAENRDEVRSLRSRLDVLTNELQSSMTTVEETNEELRTANDELHKANVQLETQLEELRGVHEAMRDKDEFLAMLAHELRSPLAPILNATHILQALAGDLPRVTQARDIIERQVRHQARLIDDLLDISRITLGKIDLRRRPEPLAEIVAQGVETAAPLIKERRHELSIVHAPEPLTVDADRVRLAQVVGNLLSNAAKYTPPGGRIGLSTERDGQSVVLRVTDSGVGIPRDMLERVFTLFTQVDSSLARSQEAWVSA
jgi:signal transduction histidine kinase